MDRIWICWIDWINWISRLAKTWWSSVRLIAAEWGLNDFLLIKATTVIYNYNEGGQNI